MKILFLSKNMSAYKAAMYQRDVMEELAIQQSVVFYGPGFDGFDPSETLAKKMKKLGNFDVIITGHSWLPDGGKFRNPFPGLKLDRVLVPKFFILNKEYTNLSEKLTWASNQGFQRGFSHHHGTDYLTKEAEIPFSFWPFGFLDGSRRTLSRHCWMR